MTPQFPATALGDALARVTERTAIAAEALVGRGDEQAADIAAAQAMRNALDDLPVHGRIVVGDPDVIADDNYVLPTGFEFGADDAPELDFALDPIEGSTIAAKAKANAISVIAAAPRGGFMPAPDIYMEKLAIGPGHDGDLLDLDAPAGEIALRLARSKGVDISEITACVLDRPRHEKIISDLRRAGARVNLIGDGDVAAVIQTALPENTVDMYAGEGGAPEGVLAAAALKCVGGQMLARLVIRSNEDRRLAEQAGVNELQQVYSVETMVTGTAVFAASGITRGPLLDGVTRTPAAFETHTLVMTSSDGVVRRVRSTMPRPLPGAGAHD